jgi:NAD(P)-dependent dehydrogenase (short-subunit alcohol dehydrogenase family)
MEPQDKVTLIVDARRGIYRTIAKRLFEKGYKILWSPELPKS